jgi:hypothetical protein
MTINGGGDFSLLQLFPKLIFCLLGLVGKGGLLPLPNIRRSLTKEVHDDQTTVGWKGGETLVPVDCYPEERSDEGSPIQLREFYFTPKIKGGDPSLRSG